MILGIGTDLCEIKRIEALLCRHAGRALRRLLTPNEQTRAQKFIQPAAFVAKRFAAKEALVKALGLGFRKGISFQDIEVVNDPDGAPHMVLSGPAKAHLEAKVPLQHAPYIHVSLSDGKDHALAFVVIEARPHD